jgi:hypothetical protein
VIYLVSRKALALFVIVALLSLRLSGLTERVFVVPVEDAIFDVAFITTEESPVEGKPLKVKPKRALEIVLTPVDVVLIRGERPQPWWTAVDIILTLQGLRTEIFIPPETLA